MITEMCRDVTVVQLLSLRQDVIKCILLYVYARLFFFSLPDLFCVSLSL